MELFCFVHFHNSGALVLVSLNIEFYSIKSIVPIFCLQKNWHNTPQLQGQQPILFWRVSYITLTDLSASSRILVCLKYQLNFSLLVTYQRKAACTKCTYIKTIFYNKCGLLQCCSCHKHFNQIHHYIR